MLRMVCLFLVLCQFNSEVSGTAFKNNGPAKKNQQAKPKRDKITGVRSTFEYKSVVLLTSFFQSFLPLPAKEINPSIVRNENALEGVSHMGKVRIIY